MKRDPSEHPSFFVRHAPAIATAANVVGLPLSIAWPVAAVQRVATNPFSSLLTGYYGLKSLPPTFQAYSALAETPEVHQYLAKHMPGIFEHGPSGLRLKPYESWLSKVLQQPEQFRQHLRSVSELASRELSAPHAELVGRFHQSFENLIDDYLKALEKHPSGPTATNIAAALNEMVQRGTQAGTTPRKIVAEWGKSFFGPAFGTAIGAALLTNLLPYWVDPYKHPYLVGAASLASIPIGAWSIREMTKPAVEGLQKLAPWTLAGKWGKVLFPVLGGLVGAIPAYQAWAQYQASKRRHNPLYASLYSAGL